MSIDDYAGMTIGEWQRTSILLVRELHHDEGGEYPAIQVAASQMSERARGHDPM